LAALATVAVALLAGCNQGTGGSGPTVPDRPPTPAGAKAPVADPAVTPPVAGAQLHLFQAQPNQGPRTAVFLPDGHRALFGTGAVWNLDTWKEEAHLDFPQIRQPISQFALLPEGQRLLASCWDHNAYLFDLQSGKEVQRYAGHDSNVNCIAVSSDRRRALTGGQSDKSLRLWEVESGKQVAVVASFPAAVQRVAFLPGDQQALVGSDKVHVLDLEGRKDVRAFEGKWNRLGSCLVLAANGRQVLSATDSLVLWDVETGNELRRFGKTTGMVWCLALSADGRRTLSAGDDHVLRLWEVETGKELAALKGHTGIVLSVSFSADGRRALSCGQDETIRYWQLPE
jgi:WD40 repeat protein